MLSGLYYDPCCGSRLGRTATFAKFPYRSYCRSQPSPPAIAAPERPPIITTLPTLINNTTKTVPSTSPPPPALQKDDFLKFVSFFRHASPYIEGHTGRTFVIIIPGNVASIKPLLSKVLDDVALLHGLGVKVVVILGVEDVIEKTLQERNLLSQRMAGYRITDQDTLTVAVEAVAKVVTFCEQSLSKGPAIPMIRRHTKGDSEIHFEPALNVVSGNFVTAKRRGVVDGIDYGLTGEVRFVMKDSVQKQLKLGNIVVLSQLGYTAAGEVLNCSAYDVGLQAAVNLKADKIFCLHLDEVNRLQLPQWLSLSDAQDMLLDRVQGLLSIDDPDNFMTNAEADSLGSMDDARLSDARLSDALMEVEPVLPQTVLDRPRKDILEDLHVWRATGFPTAVSTCVIACCKGIKRAHLVDASLEGGLLLELYTRDGVGTMISTDFYEGLRKARDSDVESVQALLEPLVKSGVLVQRSRAELAASISDFIVVERENKILGCTMLLPLGATEDGISVAEVGAVCVDPASRGSGRGDSMLDYVEQEARSKGVKRLVLLTTRTADWFEQRGFQFCGPAYLSRLLPEARRIKVNPARNSQLYVKELEELGDLKVKPGKRIGF